MASTTSLLTRPKQDPCFSVRYTVLGEPLILGSNTFFKLDIVIDNDVCEHCLHLVSDEETPGTRRRR